MKTWKGNKYEKTICANNCPKLVTQQFKKSNCTVLLDQNTAFENTLTGM